MMKSKGNIINPNNQVIYSNIFRNKKNTDKLIFYSPIWNTSICNIVWSWGDTAPRKIITCEFYSGTWVNGEKQNTVPLIIKCYKFQQRDLHTQYML